MATNKPLSDLVARGLFRADLFYRLSGVEIHVPPLRARREDIRELATYFLERHRATRPLTIADAVLDALRLYDWPGNVRELERLMERAITLVASNQIELEDLPPHVCGRYGEVLGPSIAASESMRAWGSRYARLIFERCNRNKRAAARYLDISYHTLEAYLGYGYAPCAPTGHRTPEWARRRLNHASAEAELKDVPNTQAGQEDQPLVPRS